VLSGGGLAIGAMLCGVSGLAFAIGVYLPLSTMAPLFVGGCVRALVARSGALKEGDADPGILAASGLVAGEGLAGVALAALVVTGFLPKEAAPRLAETAGTMATLVVLLSVCLFLYLAGRDVRPADASRA
jgi:hypothetical protein